MKLNCGETLRVGVLCGLQGTREVPISVIQPDVCADGNPVGTPATDIRWIFNTSATREIHYFYCWKIETYNYNENSMSSPL